RVGAARARPLGPQLCVAAIRGRSAVAAGELRLRPDARDDSVAGVDADLLIADIDDVEDAAGALLQVDLAERPGRGLLRLRHRLGERDLRLRQQILAVVERAWPDEGAVVPDAGAAAERVGGAAGQGERSDAGRDDEGALVHSCLLSVLVRSHARRPS